MKNSDMSLRFMTAAVMLAVLMVAVLVEIKFPTIYAVRWIGVAVVIAAIFETIKCYTQTTREKFQKSAIFFILFLGLLGLMLKSVYVVGARPWIMLWMLMIIVGADIGGWTFGKIIGGDKMWEKLSANKTWSGQIGGIFCGTLMSMIYCKLFGTNVFNAIWVGIAVSLLSQYGDLTASFIKRRLGIKDFSNILPGHGGILDRFDGWIYVLPLLWLMLR